MVLQVTLTGGLFSLGSDVPKLTLWESGRAVFWTDDLVIRETRLTPEAVGRVLSAASAVYDLDDRYAMRTCLDLNSTLVSIDGSRGPKTVTLSCFTLNSPAYRDDEAAPEIAGLVRRIYQEAWRELPAQAPPLMPTEVVVRTHRFGGTLTPEQLSELRHWPGELVGHLAGAHAREALAHRGTYRGNEDLYWLDGTAHGVSVVPVLPLLHLPADGYTLRIPPRHPATVGTNLPGYPYQYHGVSQGEVARWYRSEMAKAGWQMAHEEGESFQVWTWSEHPHYPLTTVRFGPDSLTMEVVQGDFLPHLPGATPTAGDCDPQARVGVPESLAASVNCYRAPDLAPDEVARWMRQHLGYLGWHEDGPGRFWRAMPLPAVHGPFRPPFLGDTPQIEHEGLRLEVRPADPAPGWGPNPGTLVVVWRELVVPDGGWPAPADEERWPLCDQTRGGEIEIAGQIVSLPRSLCVTLEEPTRMRIQVAYGASFVDVDPATGWTLTVAGPWNDGDLIRPLRPTLQPGMLPLLQGAQSH